MKGKRKKRPVTLIEIMIVILLIGLIGGALAFNMRGSLDKGRQFKTEQNISRVYDALMMEYARGGDSLEQIVDNRENILQNCPFIKYTPDLLNGLTITQDPDNDEIVVTSNR